MAAPGKDLLDEENAACCVEKAECSSMRPPAGYRLRTVLVCRDVDQINCGAVGMLDCDGGCVPVSNDRLVPVSNDRCAGATCDVTDASDVATCCEENVCTDFFESYPLGTGAYRYSFRDIAVGVRVECDPATHIPGHDEAPFISCSAGEAPEDLTYQSPTGCVPRASCSESICPTGWKRKPGESDLCAGAVCTEAHDLATCCAEYQCHPTSASRIASIEALAARGVRSNW